MQNDKNTELLRNKIEALDTLSGGIVYGKEEAWQKLQQRMERKPAIRIATKPLAAAAVILLLVTAFVTYRHSAKEKEITNATVRNNSPVINKPVQPQESVPETINAVAVETPMTITYHKATVKPVDNKQQPTETIKEEPLGKENLLFTTANVEQPKVVQPQPVKKMRVVHISELNSNVQEEQTITAAGGYTAADVSRLPVVHINDVMHEEYEVHRLLQENRLGSEQKFLPWKNRMDAGMEVIYTGLRQTPEMVVNTALQEDVDAIGISILSGAHMTVFPKVMQLMKEKGLNDVLLTGGGIIPDEDMKELQQMGVGRLFPPSAPTTDIANYITGWVAEHRNF